MVQPAEPSEPQTASPPEDAVTPSKNADAQNVDARRAGARKTAQKLRDIATVASVYLASGAMIVYGGINVSLNFLQATRGLYKNQQWQATLPFVVLFGLLPILIGIALLVWHPATRSGQNASSNDKIE